MGLNSLMKKTELGKLATNRAERWPLGRFTWRLEGFKNLKHCTSSIHPDTCRCCVYTIHAMPVSYKDRIHSKKHGLISFYLWSLKDLYLGSVVSSWLIALQPNTKPCYTKLNLNQAKERSPWSLLFDYMTTLCRKKNCTSSYATVSVLAYFFVFFAAQSSFGNLAAGRIRSFLLFHQSQQMRNRSNLHQQTHAYLDANRCEVG